MPGKALQAPQPPAKTWVEIQRETELKQIHLPTSETEKPAQRPKARSRRFSKVARDPAQALIEGSHPLVAGPPLELGARLVPLHDARVPAGFEHTRVFLARRALQVHEPELAAQDS